MSERVLTVRQPWADLIMAGVKDVENRTWPVPSTVPCARCRWPATSVNACVGGSACSQFPFRLWVHSAASVAPKRSPLWLRGGLPHDEHGIGVEWSRWASLFAPHARQSSPLSKRLGALLGSVTVTGCHQTRSCIRLGAENEDGYVGVQGCSRWSDLGAETWHWTLADPIPLDEPWPLKGRQGLWTLPDGLDELIHLEHTA